SRIRECVPQPLARGVRPQPWQPVEGGIGLLYAQLTQALTLVAELRPNHPARPIPARLLPDGPHPVFPRAAQLACLVVEAARVRGGLAELVGHAELPIRRHLEGWGGVLLLSVRVHCFGVCGRAGGAAKSRPLLPAAFLQESQSGLCHPAPPPMLS